VVRTALTIGVFLIGLLAVDFRSLAFAHAA
jgi:hypothetical protein